MRRKITITILVALLTLTLALGILVACKPEESTEYTITFNANGIGENMTVSGKSGENITEKLPKLADTADWYFGGWYDNESLAGSSVTLPATMPEGNKTYYARWYINYSVQVYVEVLSGDGFEFSKELSYSVELNKGSVPATVDVSINPAPTGLYLDSDVDHVLTLNGRDNEITLNYKRTRHSITYHVNADIEIDDDVTIDSVYGATVTLDADMFDVEQFAQQGYRFAGYSLTAEGAELLATGAKLTIEKDLHVYAIWDKAYVDRNGGDDWVYIPKHEAGVAYLDRYGLEEKKGVYNATSKVFSFATDDEDFTYTGKVYDDYTFVANRGMDKYPFYFYDVNEDVIYDNAYIEFGAFDTATLHIPAEAAGKIATWYYDGDFNRVALPTGEYEATYRYDDIYGGFVLTIHVSKDSDGTVINSDVDFYIIAVTVSDDDETYDTFIVQGAEAGYYAEKIDEEGNVEGNSLILDGYGNAVYINNSGYAYLGEYVYDEDLGKVYVTLNIGYFSAMISEFVDIVEDGIYMGYLVIFDNHQANFSYYNDYDEDYTDFYEATVTFSGYGYALYSDDDGIVTYNYEFVYEEVLGTTNISFVRLYDRDTHVLVYSLVLDSYYETFLIVPNTGYIRALTDFANAMSIMVFDGEGHVYMYKYDVWYESYGYIYEIGTVEKIEDNLYAVSVGSDSFNFFELETDGVVTAYYEGTEVYNDSFEGTNGSKLRLDGWGNAIYFEANGRYHIGRYFNLEHLFFQCSDEYCYVEFAFEVNQEMGSFTILEDQSEAEGEFAYYSSGSKSDEIILAIDEQGVAVIKVNDVEAVKGIVTYADFAKSYLLFTVTELVDASAVPSALTVDFLFIQGTYSGDLVFKLSDGYEGEYSVEDADGIVLTLDGFGYGSIAQGNNAVGGVYMVYVDSNIETHVVYFITDNGYEYYFDIWADGSVTMRGGEFSLDGYVLTNLNGLYPFFILPDGNGNLEIVFFDTDTLSMYYMAVGKYTFSNGYGKAFDIEYTVWVEDEASHTTQEEADFLNYVALLMREGYMLDDEFEFRLVAMNGVDCFMLYNESWDTVITLDDWSVIITDGYLTARYINRYGDVYVGQYFVENVDGYLYDVVRFYSNYGSVYTFKVSGNYAKLIGNEFGSYLLYGHEEDDNAPELFLDGVDYVSFFDGEITMVGKYTYDAISGIVKATFSLSGGDVVMLFKIDTAYMDFLIHDDELAGEYVGVDDPDSTLTLDGFDGATLNSNGTYTYYYIEQYMGNVYMLVDLDSLEVSYVKLDLEHKTFMLSDDSNIIDNIPLFDVLTGQDDRDNTVSIDGFGLVTMNGQLIGTLIEKDTSSKANGYNSFTTYTVQTSSGEIKFATYRIYFLDYNTLFYAPYNEKYDVTLTKEDSSEPMKLNGYGTVLLEKDTYERNVYYFDGEKLVLKEIFGSDPKVYDVDWERGVYAASNDIDESVFVIEGNVLTGFTGSPNADKILEIKIPDRVTEIADGVFKGKGVTSIDLNNVEKVGKEAFAGATMSTGTLVSVTAPHLKEIGESAFQYAQMTEIDLPAVVTIGVKAFYASQPLALVNIGEDILSIGKQAFMGCGNKGDKVLVFNIASEHAPELTDYSSNIGAAAVNRTVNFTSQTAYNEAINGQVQGWSQVGTLTINYVPEAPQALVASYDLYFDNKKVA